MPWWRVHLHLQAWHIAPPSQAKQLRLPRALAVGWLRGWVRRARASGVRTMRRMGRCSQGRRQLLPWLWLWQWLGRSTAAAAGLRRLRSASRARLLRRSARRRRCVRVAHDACCVAGHHSEPSGPQHSMGGKGPSVGHATCGPSHTPAPVLLRQPNQYHCSPRRPCQSVSPDSACCFWPRPCTQAVRVARSAARLDAIRRIVAQVLDVQRLMAATRMAERQLSSKVRAARRGMFRQAGSMRSATAPLRMRHVQVAPLFVPLCIHVYPCALVAPCCAR